LDIGANVGLKTLLVADRVQHAVLFEPNPIAAERAKENLRLNHLGFQVVAQALSDTVGNVQFEHAEGVSSCNRTVDGFTTLRPSITVPRTTFDQFLSESRQNLPPVCAVKIDVEGHENSVLRGMKAFLKSRRPKLVMFEYLQRTDIVETLRIFRDVGYSVLELSPTGPHAATERVDALQDLFACPVERTKDFGITGL
jgi:FkbM family methyltransferase